MKGSNTRIVTKFGAEFRLVGEYVYMVHFADYGEPIYRQICEGGGFSGSTLTATEDDFRKVVRRWRRQRRRGNE